MIGINRAVILAAGPGSRLKWLTHNRPKALMPLSGEPVIVRLIRKLASQGIRDIAINIHHHADQLIQSLSDGSRFGVRLYFSREKQLLNSGGGACQAMELLPGYGLLVIHNTDVLSDIDVRILARSCPNSGACLSLVSNPVHHPEGDFSLRAGLVSISPDGYPRYTFSGVSVWEQSAFGAWSPGQPFSLTEAIRRLADERRCTGILHDGLWLDMGRPRDLIQAGRCKGTSEGAAVLLKSPG